MFAGQNGYYQVVDILNANADPNIQRQFFWTGLMFASENGHHHQEKADSQRKSRFYYSSTKLVDSVNNY